MHPTKIIVMSAIFYGAADPSFPVAVKSATAMLRRFPHDDSRVAAVKFVLLGSTFPKL
jgi:hypothetical protein